MFANRQDAGRQLASRLRSLVASSQPVVLALPRGGVPVAYEVALALAAPLDVFIVRKIGVPGQEELAMGAIASGGTVIYNREVISSLDISEEVFARVTRAEEMEIQRREREYRGSKPATDVTGKTVILVDDGVATGATMQAAAEALRKHEPKKLILAAPVIAPGVLRRFSRCADSVVALLVPRDFQAVGGWYEDFSQTSDDEVRDLLLQADLRISQQLPGDGHSPPAMTNF